MGGLEKLSRERETIGEGGGELGQHPKTAQQQQGSQTEALNQRGRISALGAADVAEKVWVF